jgi:fructokinase
VNFFRERRVASIGLAWFGPLDVDPKSKTYGYVTSTPKAQWRNVDVLSPFKPLGVPLGFDTDVQAAAVGELNYGKHGAISSCAYITVGTGVGVGVIVHGRPVYGLTHPEGGHVRVQRHPKDKYTGNCRYHGDCVEGLTNAESIAARAGCHESNLKSLPDNHLAFEIVAYYLGQLCCNLVLTVSPQVIVLGGGVMQRKSLFPRIRQQVLSLLNGYVQMDKILNDIDSYIVPSIHDQGPENNAGLVGALELARLALAQRSKL